MDQITSCPEGTGASGWFALSSHTLARDRASCPSHCICSFAQVEPDLKGTEIIVPQNMHLPLKHCLSASLMWASLESSSNWACGFVLQSTDTWSAIGVQLFWRGVGRQEALGSLGHCLCQGLACKFSLWFQVFLSFTCSSGSTHLNRHSPVTTRICQPASNLQSKEKATKL